MVGGDGGGSGVRIGFDVGLLIELNEIRNPVSQYLPIVCLIHMMKDRTVFTKISYFINLFPITTLQSSGITNLIHHFPHMAETHQEVHPGE